MNHRGPHRIPRMSEDTFDRETQRLLQTLATRHGSHAAIVYRDGAQYVCPVGKEKETDRVLWRTW